MIMRIISNRYAVRCPGCGFRLLGHRAEGEILGEVVWRTKSLLKPRTLQVSTMHLPCWQRTEVGEELQETRAVVPRCCFSGHTSHHKVGRLREVSSRSLSHFSIRRAVSRAPHSLWTDKPHEVYILCCGVFDHSGRLKSELKSTLNAKWFAVSECTAELPVPLDFWLKAKLKSVHFFGHLAPTPWSWHTGGALSCWAASSWTGLFWLLQRKVSVNHLKKKKAA